MNKINIARIFFALFLLFGLIRTGFGASDIETNILKAVLDEKSDRVLIELSKKGASKVNVVFTGGKADELQEEFYNRLDKKHLKKEDANKLFEVLEKYPNNFLSPKKRTQLKHKEYDKLAQESLEMLYAPLSLALLPLDKDPFMLFTEYIMSLREFAPENNVLTLEFNKETAQNTELLNKEIKKLIVLQKELSSDNTKIYLTGASVHSYFAAIKSALEINLICLFSALMVFGLCKFYFKSFKIVFPIACGIITGILCGYFTTSLFFPSIHILTLVFSTTLIGISLDYLLHYLIEKDLKKIFKSISISLVTTTCAFCVLFLSGTELLKQIALFTTCGLLGVYLFTILFFPCMVSKIKYSTGNLKIPKPKTSFVLFLCAVSLFGLFQMRFDDNIKTMYKPPKELLQGEKLLKSEPVTFAVASAQDFESLRQKEEQLAQALPENTQYISLSRFLPSDKRQIENQKLILELYKDKPDFLLSFLDEKQHEDILKNYQNELLTLDNVKGLNDFLIDENTSAILLKNASALPEIDGINYIDPSYEISQKMKKIKEKCLLLLIPVFFTISIVLALLYKPKCALKLVLPSALGVVFTFGILSVLGHKINLFHILAAFLIIGFSLDYSIFKVSGLKNSKDAVFISCITSAFSFILLSFASFKLISSLGLSLALGLLSSYIFSLLLISEK